MTTPNEPDKDHNPKSSGGPVNGSGSATLGTGTPVGGLVPPWQRGPAEESPKTTRIETPARDSVPGNRQSGPPPRGIVTSAPAEPGGQAPVTNLENPPRGQTATATREEPKPFIESPTSNIDRDRLPSEQLPDLDEIHHTAEAKRIAEEKATAARSAPTQVRASGRPLRASVQVRRIDPWATFKIAAVLSVIGFIVWMIAIAVLYLVLDGMGVWEQVNNSFGTLVTADGSSTDGDIISGGTVFGIATLIGAINAVLVTALATIGSYIYNICADLVGGAEVTLADLD
ncbi:DUF3566 domain-containing protein [Gordonia sp. ABSL1-1]|uniref:DUF3566 domain-containing protein n=1 Tax=Gordonia sp. ABSL1-1 TaxID=3053923 RepID=UPI0025748A78|nr:DUF3566 domain-containing protein [Gordonia sp. ABSL1-1]MDL9936626.1 DUF3566 domain-containing protein [Gordonia sp. ABSL1-1]